MKNKFIFLQKMREVAGFTLVEMMVVVAIIAILAAIAVPNYADYVTRGRIPDATSNLATKRVQMEQFFQDNHTYVCATCTGALPPACVADSLSSKYFTFDCAGTYGVTPTATVYTIEAVGVGPMIGFVYTIDYQNSKASYITATGWTNPNPNICWATKKGGVC